MLRGLGRLHIFPGDDVGDGQRRAGVSPFRRAITSLASGRIAWRRDELAGVQFAEQITVQRVASRDAALSQAQADLASALARFAARTALARSPRR